MTYPQALKYLDSFINYEKKNTYNYRESFKLDRMKRMASLLGDPQDAVRSIHIAGSKGKGSTSAITQSILRNAGFDVGLYTSPHLVSFTERIRINDTLISEYDVGRLLGKVKKAVDRMRKDRPSFFEVYTALAYLYFKEKKADFAVYEVGLGGRLDATNIITPLACGITPISYEHTDKLGHTLSAIAAEKAGIIKEGAICVVAPQKAKALKAIERICKDRNARMIQVSKDIRFKEISSSEDKEVFRVSGIASEYPLLEMRLLGPHQVVNAATAIGIVESLRFSGVEVPYEAIQRGIECVRWNGRFEVVSKKPHVILDGAQNKASANALACAVKKIYGNKKLTLILGVSKDKDIKGILEELLPIADSVILTKSNVASRAMDPEKVKKLIPAKYKKVFLTEGVVEALGKAHLAAGKDEVILVAGSLFVVGEARNHLLPRRR